MYIYIILMKGMNVDSDIRLSRNFGVKIHLWFLKVSCRASDCVLRLLTLASKEGTTWLKLFEGLPAVVPKLMLFKIQLSIHILNKTPLPQHYCRVDHTVRNCELKIAILCQLIYQLILRMEFFAIKRFRVSMWLSLSFFGFVIFTFGIKLWKILP